VDLRRHFGFYIRSRGRGYPEDALLPSKKLREELHA